MNIRYTHEFYVLLRNFIKKSPQQTVQNHHLYKDEHFTL